MLKINGKNYQNIIQFFRLAGIYSKEENLITRIKKNNSKIIKKKTISFQGYI